MIVLTIKRWGMLYKKVTVHYRTLDGSASSQTGDYQEIADTQMTFGEQEDTKTILVTVLDDDLPEGNETFSIQLYDAAGNAITPYSSSLLEVIISHSPYSCLMLQVMQLLHTVLHSWR